MADSRTTEMTPQEARQWMTQKGVPVAEQDAWFREQGIEPPPMPKGPGLGQQVGRGLGLTARGLGQGVIGTATLPATMGPAADIAGRVVEALGLQRPNFQNAGPAGMDALGLPQAENLPERLQVGAMEGVGGALPTMGMGAVAGAGRPIVQALSGVFHRGALSGAAAAGELAASAGAGVGAELVSGSENPWVTGAAALVGALVGRAPVRAALPGPLAVPTEEILEAGARQRVGVTAGMAGQGAGGLAYTERAAGHLLGGVGEQRRVAKEIHSQLREATERLAREIARKANQATKEQIGDRLMAKVLKRNEVLYRTRVSNRWDAIRSQVQMDAPAMAPNFMALAQKTFTLPNPTTQPLQYTKALEIMNPAMRDVAGIWEVLVREGAPTIESLWAFRQQIGSKLADYDIAMKSQDYGLYKRAYASLSKDLETAVALQNPKLKRAWLDASKATKRWHQETERVIAPLVARKSGEAAYEFAFVNPKASRLRVLYDRMTPAQRRMVTGSLITRLGLPSNVADMDFGIWSPSKFMENWGTRMDPNVKAILTDGWSDVAKRDLDDLVTLHRAATQAGGMLANPSGTAAAGFAADTFRQIVSSALRLTGGIAGVAGTAGGALGVPVMGTGLVAGGAAGLGTAISTMAASKYTVRALSDLQSTYLKSHVVARWLARQELMPSAMEPAMRQSAIQSLRNMAEQEEDVLAAEFASEYERAYALAPAPSVPLQSGAAVDVTEAPEQE